MGQAENGNTAALQQLSKENLCSHQSVQQPITDANFAKALIRQESIHMFYQALHVSSREGEGKDQSNARGIVVAQPRDGDSLESILKLHTAAEPSSATPMERWATVSSTNEQFPLFARRAMLEMDLGEGSLELFETRAAAARATAAEVDRMGKNTYPTVWRDLVAEDAKSAQVDEGL